MHKPLWKELFLLAIGNMPGVVLQEEFLITRDLP